MKEGSHVVGIIGPVTAAAPTLFSTQEATIILSRNVLTLGTWHGERRDLPKGHSER